MRDVDRAVRRLVFAHFARTGRAPQRAELAERLGRSDDWVGQRLTSLAEARAVVLDDDGNIEQAPPFSNPATAVEVRTASGRFFAACPWQGFGLAALFGPSATLSVTCGACGEALALDAATVFHLSVPARSWWVDVRRTQATTLGFCDAAHLARWLAASGQPRGDTVAARVMDELGARWYGRHLDADWQPRSAADRQALLDELGLTGSFWQLVVH